MPAGKFRTYGSSKSGAVQFLGESNIDHTGRKETVEVLMGEAFGVTAKHISKEQRRVSRYITELTQGWELINSEDTAITIRLTETNLGSGAESVKFDTRYSDYVPEKHVEGVYRTEVTLDPGEKRQVFYKARVTYP